MAPLMKDGYFHIRIHNKQQWQVMGAPLWECWQGVINQQSDQSYLILLPLTKKKCVFYITHLSLSM